MHWLSVILLGVSTNLDNMFIGISLGLQGKRVPFLMNTVIGLFSAAATLLVCLFSSFGHGSGRTPNIIGGAVIILFGLLSLLPGKECENCSRTHARLLWKDVMPLGACLAVNCVPVAFGAGLTGLSPWATALSVGVMSVAAVEAGNRVGISALRICERRLNILGCVLMVGLGIMEILI